MDIKIAIIDQNKIFRESLKVLLEQIPGFIVATTSDINTYTESLIDESVEVLLLDDSQGQERCQSILRSARSRNKSLKIIILTQDTEGLFPGFGETEVMLKSSGKKAFESKIKNLNN